jgi:hypothetical protein
VTIERLLYLCAVTCYGAGIDLITPRQKRQLIGCRLDETRST